MSLMILRGWPRSGISRTGRSTASTPYWPPFGAQAFGRTGELPCKASSNMDRKPDEVGMATLGNKALDRLQPVSFVHADFLSLL